MNYVYCGSHLPLLFALSLKNKGEKITILSFSEDVIKYCNDENIDFIKLEYIRPTASSPHKVFTLKRMLDNALEKIECGKEDCFFLTGRGKDYDSFYLAKELSKRGCTIYYTDSGGAELKKYIPPGFKPFFIRGEVIRVLFKLILNLDLKCYTIYDVPFFGIDDEFIEKYNVKEYALERTHPELILEVAKKSKISYGKCENLIADQGSLAGVINFYSLKNVYKNLFDLPLKFSFKKHPGPTQQENKSDILFYKLFKHCDEIPKHIPIELLCNNIRKNMISVFSFSLIVASNFKHLKAISLLELVDWCDDSFKSTMKKLLIEKSKNKILFPKNFDELKEILLSN